jgi:hypothetical protein
MKEETKQKIRETKLGVKNPMFGKPSWNRGKKLPYPVWNKGRKMSDETKKKVSDSKKKNPTRYWLGKKLSSEHKANLKKHHSHSLIGENSPNWKGGVTPEHNKIRDSIESKLWIHSVFARDNWTCQKYGTKGGNLTAHHILNFSSHPELRFAIDNGITLSVKAHKEFHHKYGIKNNTREQLNDFLSDKIVNN